MLNSETYMLSTGWEVRTEEYFLKGSEWPETKG